MITLKANVRRNDTVSYIQYVMERVERSADIITRKHAQLVVTTAQASMRAGKSGRHYVGLPNTSSAPGEALATQSGATSASFKAVHDAKRGYYRIGTPLWYANWLMTERNRPTLEPALREVEPLFYRAIREMIERTV